MNFINNLIKSINCPLTDKELELMNELKGYRLDWHSYRYYTSNIRNCGDDSYSKAKNKIIRNIILADEAPKNKKRPWRKTYYYGFLTIIIDTNEKEIVWLESDYDHEFTFEPDKVKKEWLNRKLGINKIDNKLHKEHKNITYKNEENTNNKLISEGNGGCCNVSYYISM